MQIPAFNRKNKPAADGSQKNSDGSDLNKAEDNVAPSAEEIKEDDRPSFIPIPQEKISEKLRRMASAHQKESICEEAEEEARESGPIVYSEGSGKVEFKQSNEKLVLQSAPE